MSQYHVTIYATPMPLPIHFLLHTWVVVEHSGKTDRFDVFGFKEDGPGVRCGYVYKNFNRPERGAPLFAIGQYRFLAHKTWKSRVLFAFSGGNNSDAHKVHALLQQNLCEVPSASKYNGIFGPNSNSFTQWVLDTVAPGKYPLPWNAHGKKYIWKE